MRGQRAQQVQAILGQRDLVISTERVDDVARLIGQRVKMGCGAGLDRQIPRPWKPRGISWGWTAVLWWASILTEGDHRKVSGEADIKGMKTTLSRLSPEVIDPLDCRAARRGHLRTYVSQPPYGQRLAAELKAPSLAG